MNEKPEFVAIIARVFPLGQFKQPVSSHVNGSSKRGFYQLEPINARPEFTREELLKLADELEKP